MNKYAAALASAFFFLVIFVEIIQISGSIERINQNITAISNSLFGEYLVPFELISLILVGGIIGMLYISGREE